MKTAVIAMMLALSPTAYAQNQSPTLEQIEIDNKLNDVLDLINKAEASLEIMSRERRTQCLQAFGHTQFCGCVMDKLPVAWSFSQYVAITTASKEENGYEELDAERKGAYDRVPAIRDQCAASMRQQGFSYLTWRCGPTGCAAAQWASCAAIISVATSTI